MSLVEQLQAMKGSLPDSVHDRKLVAEAAKELARAAEPVYDQTQRVLYSNLILPVVRVAVELKLFKLLSEGSPKHFTTSQLAAATRADPITLSRSVCVI
jgi:hypothetical protein